MKNEITVAVNNDQMLKLIQFGHDRAVILSTTDSAGNLVDGDTISPGDLVTAINWCRYQKSIGNDTLTF